MELWGTRWVSACNTVGSQTQVTVTNWTHHHLFVRLEVAGVTYQRGLLPPNEDAEALQYGPRDGASASAARGSNFAVLKLPCGFAWYTVSATVCTPSEMSEGWVGVASPKKLHFVYGGSLVSVHYDSTSDTKISLLNESTKLKSNEASEKLESVIASTSATISTVFEEHVNPAVNVVKDKIKQLTLAKDEDQSYGTDSLQAGLPTHGRLGPQDTDLMFYSDEHESQLPQGMTEDWRFDAEDDPEPPSKPLQPKPGPPGRHASDCSV